MNYDEAKKNFDALRNREDDFLDYMLTQKGTQTWMVKSYNLPAREWSNLLIEWELFELGY